MPHARHTDPSTSHAAAASVSNVSKTRSVVLSILEVSSMADHELVATYRRLAENGLGVIPAASESGVRSRRAELVVAGLVKDSGARVKSPTGRSSIVWQVA